MNRIHVAAAAVNQTPLDWSGNQERLRKAIAIAREDGATVLCLPEMGITGYGCEDMFLSPAVGRRALESLAELAPESRGMVIAVGLPLWIRGAVFNTVAVLVDGTLAGFAAKQHLAGDGIHYEPRWFKPWPEGIVETVEIAGASVLVGDLIWDIGGVRIGFEICEDAWAADRPGAALARRGADLILNPSASHFAFGKQAVRRRWVLEGSRAFHCAYLFTNLLGNESGRIIFDGGAMIASGGELVAAGPRLSLEEVTVTSATVDVSLNRVHRARTFSFEPDLGVETGDVKVGDFSWPECSPAVEVEMADPVDFSKEEAFTRAVSLALFDYLRKSRSRGFIISLSGGADSAAVACLCRLMIELAWHELGPRGFRERLAYLGETLPDSVEDIAAELITCVYQATRNSSDTTETAARELAEALGATFHRWDVDALVEGYTTTVESAIGRELSWETDDIPLQNIQARVRAPGVWMLANLRNALLLSTSNRSEAAVGYATMDGDTCGGLSPIAGIDKAFLRQWLRWLEKEGRPPEIPSVPALSFVNIQQPTAELRPQESEQTDEGDLMPYPLLDAIERAAIRDKKGPVEVLELMTARFPEYHHEQLTGWVRRFFGLWSRNQWKRERYAPSFHLDDENLDPKTWCRFPILSGGFEGEI